jgi:hypothetical protein
MAMQFLAHLAGHCGHIDVFENRVGVEMLKRPQNGTLATPVGADQHGKLVVNENLAGIPDALKILYSDFFDSHW